MLTKITVGLAFNDEIDAHLGYGNIRSPGPPTIVMAAPPKHLKPRTVKFN
jgi:hypothetical protein